MLDRYGVERCDELCTHGEIIRAVTPEMPDEEKLYDLAELFKIFGDSTRIRILYALYERELCVCDIASLLGLTQTAVSHQLRILKANKIVKARRDGKTIFYSLDDAHVHDILNMGIEHLFD